MKQVSEKYVALRNQTGSYYDVKLVRGTGVSAVEYGVDKLKSIEISQSLFQDSGPQIGGVCSAQCTVKLRELSANWPRMAMFTVYVRIRGPYTEAFVPLNSTGLITADNKQFRISVGESASEWISMGTFYTDTRKPDKHGNLIITAYDGMLLLEQTWADKVTLPQSWPITARAMANLIVDATGVQIDARSVLEDYTAYIGLDTRSTAREMLGVIAAGMGGNWCITIEGKLLLVGFPINGQTGGAIAGIAVAGQAVVGTEESSSENDTIGAIDIGLSIMSFEGGDELPPIHTVELTSDAGVPARSTDDLDGYTLRAHCNFANTNIANLCLGRVYGYCYKPFTATGARLDPIAELGDYVSIDNELFPIIAINWRIGKHIVADIAAPFDEDVDHEYPMMSENEKTLRKAIGAADESREYVDTRLEDIASELVVDLDKIWAKVDKVHRGEHSSFSWELTSEHHNWYTVDANGAEALVMSVTGSGLTVIGEIRAKSGYIGVDGDAFSIVPRHTETEQDPISGEDIAVTYPSSIQNGIAHFEDDQHDGVYIGTDGIRLGQYFTVNKRGVVTASSGTIGGFTISQSALYSNGASSYSGTGEGVHLSASGIRLGDNFKVNNRGVVTASGLNMTGGTINLTRVVYDEDQGTDVTETVFSVSSGGNINANFTGGSFRIGDKLVLSSNSLTIGGFTIGNNSIYSNGQDEYDDQDASRGVCISPDGIRLGDNFRVDNDGNLYANSGTFAGYVWAENIQSGGSYGYISENALTSAVTNTLNSYRSAIDSTAQTHPPYFSARQIVAVSSFYGASYLVPNGTTPSAHSDEYDLVGHYHRITADSQTGNVTIGGPINGNGPAPSFNIADTEYFRSAVSAITVSSVLEYSYSATADQRVVFDNDHVHYDSTEDTLSGRARVLLSNNNAVNVYIEMDASAAGGICPVMGIDSMLYAETSGANAYSQITVTFTDDTTGTYSLPLVYNPYASESETLYNYARYIGGRSPAITNRSVTPMIYSESNPYQLEVEVEFNTNGNAQSFQATVNVYDVYEAGREAGGGGICPIMEIASVEEHSYSSAADFNLVFDNAYLRYDGINDLLNGRILVTMEDGTTQSIYVQMDAQRKSLTPPSYTVSNGNVEEDQIHPYDPTNPYVFNVVASFSVDGNNRSYTSFVNVYDVYQAGYDAGGGGSSDTYVGGWYTLLGDPELCLVNYAQVQTQLYFYEDGRYQPWTGVNLYYGTQSVRYDSGETVYLYERQT